MVKVVIGIVSIYKHKHICDWLCKIPPRSRILHSLTELAVNPDSCINFYMLYIKM